MRRALEGYEEALRFAARSHELRPSKKAALCAGMSAAKLSQPEAAQWLELCLGLQSVGEDDKEIDAQATALLKQMG